MCAACTLSGVTARPKNILQHVPNLLPIKGDSQHDTAPILTNPNLHISKYRCTFLHDCH